MKSKAVKPTTTASAPSHTTTPLLQSLRPTATHALQQLLHTSTEGSQVGSDTFATAHNFSRIQVHSKAPVNLQATSATRPPGRTYEQGAERILEHAVRVYDAQLQSSREYGGGGARYESKAGDLNVQPKLAISTPGHALEQEADRVADQVLAAPANPAVSSAPPRIQRLTGQSSRQAGTAPASTDRVLASPGRPLDPGFQQDMEQRFGHDFSLVRVHSGAAAKQSARGVNATAYTARYNIVFGAGRFVLGTHEARRLIAHELTHVLQQETIATQDQSSTPAKFTLGSFGDLFEQEADQVADDVTQTRDAARSHRIRHRDQDRQNQPKSTTGRIEFQIQRQTRSGEGEMWPASRIMKILEILNDPSLPMPERIRRLTDLGLLLNLPTIKHSLLRFSKEYLDASDRLATPPFLGGPTGVERERLEKFLEEAERKMREEWEKQGIAGVEQTSWEEILEETKKRFESILERKKEAETPILLPKRISSRPDRLSPPIVEPSPFHPNHLTVRARHSYVPSVIHEVLSSPGQPLDADTRAFMEPRFGHDFGQVRVHTDAVAAQAASSIDARAFTSTSNIVFGTGEYAPQTDSGRRLLSHELTHVVQQQAGVYLKDGLGQAGDAYERHADAMADLVLEGKQAGQLLAQMPGSAGSHGASAARAGVIRKTDQAVQMQPQPKQTTGWLVSPPILDQMKFEEWELMDKVKWPIAAKLAHEYINRNHPEPKDQEPKDPEPKVSPGRKQASYEYKWEPRGTVFTGAGLTARSYSEGNTPVPVQEPSEQRVALAIYCSLDLTKTGKGDKLTDWTWTGWKDAPEGRKKTPDEKVTELAAGAARIYAEEKTIGKIEHITIEWIAKNVLGASVAVASGAAEIIGFLKLLLDVSELLISLGEPADLP